VEERSFIDLLTDMQYYRPELNDEIGNVNSCPEFLLRLDIDLLLMVDLEMKR
jgi:hypothetical protein